MGMVMHFSDSGDATIDVDVPEDTTDITDEFRDLVDQGVSTPRVRRPARSDERSGKWAAR